MGTRSYIGIDGEDGIEAVYCHWDGYPSGVGRVLRDNYADPEKIRALVALGDLSEIGEDIGEQHEFDYARRVVGQCTFYFRDRKEPWERVGPKKSDNEQQFLAQATNHGAEWAYLYRDGGWACFDNAGAGSFGLPSGREWGPATPLDEAIERDRAKGSQP